MGTLTHPLDRVRESSPREANERIDRRAERDIAFYEQHPERIPERLRELDREWDIERALGTGSASLSLLGMVLGLTRSRKWLLLTGAVQGFYLQHQLQGWCPPLPVFRSMGVRTPKEIEAERHALEDIMDRRGVRDSRAGSEGAGAARRPGQRGAGRPASGRDAGASDRTTPRVPDDGVEQRGQTKTASRAPE